MRKMRRAFLSLLLVFGLNTASHAGIADFFVTPGATGSYVTFDGQGINAEVLAQIGIIVVYWYTFDPVTGDLLWLVGAGQIDQDRAVISFTRVSDGVFNSGAPVTRDNAYATGTIIFDSCGGGTLEYSVPGAPAGEVDFTRITPDHLCFSGGITPFPTIFNGTWGGAWNNLTFLTTGGLSFDIDIDLATGNVTIIVDIDGNAFGLPDPDPVTITGTIDENGDITIDENTELGDADITLSQDGTFTATLTNALGEVQITGSYSPVHVAFTYTIVAGGEEFANGNGWVNKNGG
jgi:hypothetical protein